MNVWPVIERELRAESRHALTYWLRVLGAGALMGVVLFAVLRSDTSMWAPRQGQELIDDLSCTLFYAIWLLVPLVTADCISREKREGTLGLLFLTPLRAGDIVVAKSFVHGWRAAALALAVVPVLAIPFLTGGIGWRDALMVFLAEYSAFCWALAGGLLASSGNKARVRALAWSMIFGVVLLSLFGLTFCVFTSSNLIWKVASDTPRWLERVREGHLLNVGSEGLWIASRPTSFFVWMTMQRRTFTLRVDWLWMAGLFALLSVVMLLGSAWLAAWNVRRSWQEKPPSRWELWWRERFCRPVVLRTFFQRWMRRSLEANPVGWLHRRTWTARMMMWGWVAVWMVVICVALSDPTTDDLRISQVYLGWLLAASLMVSAAGSFRRERENGMLELLLVTPLSERKIIWGRLRGLWGQFVPVLLLIAFAMLATWNDFFRRAWPTNGSGFYFQEAMLVFQLSCFVTAPIIGLYFSLRREGFLAAVSWAIGAGVVLPLLVGISVVLMLVLNDFRDPPLLFIVISAQAAIAIWIWVRLHRDLVGRRFALNKTGAG